MAVRGPYGRASPRHVSEFRPGLILDGAWRPQLDQLIFYNALSVLRRAFDFGYRDRPLEANPARSLRGARLRKSDRPKVDPFCMHDAETLIAAIHRDWDEAQGNYDEFRFFTGLRPSEQIALVLSDLDTGGGDSMAQDAAVAEGAVSPPLHRVSFLGELEPDARQESTVGVEAAWPQPQHDAADLRRVGPTVR